MCRGRAFRTTCGRRQVQHSGRVQAERVGPVQLEAGQFNGKNVVVDPVVQGLHDRASDVADCGHLQAIGGQHRGQHLGGGCLAIGAGDAQPGHHAVGELQPPGQLDISPDRQTARRGLCRQRPHRTPARRHHQQVGAPAQGSGGRTWAQTNVSSEQLQHLSLTGVGVGVVVVHHQHRGAQLQKCVGAGIACRPETGYHHLGLRPRGTTVGCCQPLGGGHSPITQLA